MTNSNGEWSLTSCCIHQRDDSNTKTRDEIVAHTGRKADIVIGDMADRESVKSLIPRVTSTRHVDILVPCAGINRRNPVEKFSDEDWDEVQL